MDKTYFEKPTQVVFADSTNAGAWMNGIAYGDEIICACCGGIYSIEEVIEIARENGVKKAIYEYDSWVDLTEEIYGGEMPEGLEIQGDRIVEVNEDFFDEMTDEEAAEFEAFFSKTNF